MKIFHLCTMSEPVKNKKRFTRLRHKYRLVLINEESYEQRISFRLSKLNVYTTFILISLFWIVLIVFLMGFTSLREYIPGYTDPSMRQDLYKLETTLDSLENQLEMNDLYINNIRRVLGGENLGFMDSAQNSRPRPDKSSIKNYTSPEDSLLRMEQENQNEYNIYYQESVDVYNEKLSKGPKVYFAPLSGVITNQFDPNSTHFGIDIVAKYNDAIKAIDDGVVIFAEWTLNTGYVIMIQHSGNTISTYKHNSALLKKSGEFVKAGELISIIGNSGELTSGPHLHFELWVDGSPVNPMQYIAF
jgi:murein DD-endopeptidase MepM/ murein hydrolase activator NlpD